MTNKALLILIVFGLVVSGCAAKNYAKLLNTWTGTHSDHLVAAWGPPQGVFKLSDGGSVLEYSKQRSYTTSGSTQTFTQPRQDRIQVTNPYTGETSYGLVDNDRVTTTFTPGRQVNHWCKTRFTTNSSGIIINWNTEGNNCGSM